MAQRIFYVDVDANEIVTSETDSTVAPFPALVQGDTPNFRIFLLSRSKAGQFSATPYSIIDNSGISIRVGLGPKDGLSGSLLYTQQFTWARDPLNQSFIGDFPLNTIGIASRIGPAESADAWFEIEITNESGFPWTVLQKKVQVQAEVIETPALVGPPTGQTALSLEDARSLFLGREIHGVFYLVNDSTGHKMAIYLGEDDAFHAELVTP